MEDFWIDSDRIKSKIRYGSVSNWSVCTTKDSLALAYPMGENIGDMFFHGGRVRLILDWPFVLPLRAGGDKKSNQSFSYIFQSSSSVNLAGWGKRRPN